MLYRIEKAIAHPDHTVTITWSDGVVAAVDLGPVVAKGKVFAAMQDPAFFLWSICILPAIGSALNGRTASIFLRTACASWPFRAKRKRNSVLLKI
jgi:hypothetical protein